MGTYTTSGLYKPAYGEAGSIWANPVTNNFAELETPLAGRVQETAPPRVYVSNPSLTPSASDTDPNRGNRCYPYASVQRALDESTGAAAPGPNITPGAPLEIKICPGPQIQFPTIPAGGYTAAQAFGGQAFRLTGQTRIPQWVELSGGGGLMDNSTGFFYTSLLYGDVAGDSLTDALILIGAKGTSDPGISAHAKLHDVCITNTAGSGVGVLKNVRGARCYNVAAWACKTNGFQGAKHGMDMFQLEHCDARYCAQSGVGFGLLLSAGSTGAPNLVHVSDCGFQRNADGFNNNTSGEVGIFQDIDEGTSGLPWLFDACRIGQAGFLIAGGWGGTIRAGYFESIGAIPVIKPAIQITSYYQNAIGGAPSNQATWPHCITIHGTRFHGFTGLSGVAAHVQVDAGFDVHVVNNVHEGGSFTSSAPAVWFDDTNTRVCEAALSTVVTNAWAQIASGTAGANYCHIGHSSNFGRYYNTSTGAGAKYGTLY